LLLTDGIALSLATFGDSGAPRGRHALDANDDAGQAHRRARVMGHGKKFPQFSPSHGRAVPSESCRAIQRSFGYNWFGRVARTPAYTRGGAGGTKVSSSSQVGGGCTSRAIADVGDRWSAFSSFCAVDHCGSPRDGSAAGRFDNSRFAHRLSVRRLTRRLDGECLRPPATLHPPTPRQSRTQDPSRSALHQYCSALLCTPVDAS